MEAKQNSGCAILVGSMNRAIRARDLLASAALFSKVIKIDQASSSGGCAYGVSVPCQSLKSASDVLRQAGIKGKPLSGSR